MPLFLQNVGARKQIGVIRSFPSIYRSRGDSLRENEYRPATGTNSFYTDGRNEYKSRDISEGKVGDAHPLSSLMQYNKTRTTRDENCDGEPPDDRRRRQIPPPVTSHLQDSMWSLQQLQTGHRMVVAESKNSEHDGGSSRGERSEQGAALQRLERQAAPS